MGLYNQNAASFSRALREYRSKHNLTQAALANLLQVSRRSILYWESGAKRPSWDTIIRVANLTGISYDSIMGDTPSGRTKTEDAPDCTKTD